MLMMSVWRAGGISKYLFRYQSSEVIGPSFRSLTFVTKDLNFQRHSIKTKPWKEISMIQVKCAPGNKKMSTSTKDAVLTSVAPRSITPGNRITIVGVGMVGVACAFSILTQQVSSDLVLIDLAENRLFGELLDLQHGSYFLKSAKISASTNYKASIGSKICIVTSGVRQVEGERRKDLLQRNVDVLKTIIPHLIQYSPNAILLIVTNPVDVLTYVAWKLSGLPPNRVIGSGTNLDSSRFRFLMSQKLGIAPAGCHGWIIGEHGDNSVPVWSGINVETVNLKQINPEIASTGDAENWEEIHKKVVNSGEEIIKLKGYTSWAIGLSVTDIASAILRNTGSIHAVSILANGFHGIKQDVFLSLPAVLGETGVSDILKLRLTNEELIALQNSSKILLDQQKTIAF